MSTRRTFILTGGALLALAAAPAAFAQAKPLITVYKSPSCGCCGNWEKHMAANGFRLETHPLGDVTPTKRKLGVPQDLWSCHTAMVDGYVLEGHVPAGDVKRLLRERPKATGVAVPGMPASAPGMDQRPARPYTTLAFDSASSWTFERH